jgi:antitoxin (DNA-binding transcriptional repressor) of toxin-antitoxin stability system
MSDVRIADLKARLSEHLRYVRNGEKMTVLDRDTPIARKARGPSIGFAFKAR